MKNNFWKKLNRPILALAPMAGITDSAFRTICKKYGADVTYSEMASVSALYFKPQKTLDLIRFTPSERPYVVQLFGKHPEHFAKATRIISSLPSLANGPLRSEQSAKIAFKPDGIDINFGCPAKKVFGHGSGCALMPQKKLAREIISAVCDNTDLPVSIKIRAGLNFPKNKSGTYRGTYHDTLPGENTGINAMEFIENTADLPYSAVMIHGRTYEGNFSGSVDWDLISEIKKKFPDKIVLGNGGINTPEDAVSTLKKYPDLDGLGIARGAWGRPFIFNEIKNQISPSLLGRKRSRLVGPDEGRDVTKYNFPTIKKIMFEHAELIYKDKGKLGLFEIRKHMSWYIRGFPGASELRRKLVLANSLEEINVILNKAKSVDLIKIKKQEKGVE